MIAQSVDRDERSLAVENASYRWAYHVFSYALLLLVMYRGWFHREAAWDLMTLVIVGGLVPLAYQSYHRVITNRRVLKMAIGALVGAVVAAAAAVMVMLLLRG